MNANNDGCAYVSVGIGDGAGLGRKRASMDMVKPEKTSTRRLSFFEQTMERAREIGNMPSLLGLLASKRLAKKISTRLYERRHGQNTTVASTATTAAGIAATGSSSGAVTKREPTYRMEPLRRFPKETSPLAVIKRILAENLRNVEYAPKAGARLVIYLSDEIRDYVKALDFDRYKIVCYVVLGEKKNQGATVSSRCSWDDRADGCACYTYEAIDWYCTAVVYGVYME